MAGLISVGRQYQTQAMRGLDQTAQMEKERERVEESQDQAEKTQTMGAVGTGAAVGFQVGGPWGAAIGAGIGLVASSIF